MIQSGTIGDVEQTAGTSAARQPQTHPGIPGFPQVPPGYMPAEEAARRLGIKLNTFRTDYFRKFNGIRSGSRIFYAEVDIDDEVERRKANSKTGHPTRFARPKSLSVQPSLPSNTKNITDVVPDTMVYTGKTNAAAFALFMAGKPICDVIVELKLTNEIAEYVWEKYRQFAKCFLVDSKSAEIIRSMLDDWKEEPPTGAGLAKAMMYFQRRVMKEAEMAAAPGEQLTEEEADRLRKMSEEPDLEEEGRKTT